MSGGLLLALDALLEQSNAGRELRHRRQKIKANGGGVTKPHHNFLRHLDDPASVVSKPG